MREAKDRRGAEMVGSPRVRTFGAGTIVMLVGLLAVVLWQLLAPRQVRIERTVAPSAVRLPERKPGPEELLAWSRRLGLSMEQQQQLIKLSQSLRRELEPVEADIREARSRFDELTGGAAPRPISVEEIQRAAAPVSELSLRKRALATGYSERAFAILTDSQKSEADALWRQGQPRDSGGSQ